MPLADQLPVLIWDALRAHMEADADIAGLFNGQVYSFSFFGVPPDKSPALAIVLTGEGRARDTLGGRGQGRTELTLPFEIMYSLHEPSGFNGGQITTLLRQLANQNHAILNALSKYYQNGDPYWREMRFVEREGNKTIFGREKGGYQIAATPFEIVTTMRNP